LIPARRPATWPAGAHVAPARHRIRFWPVGKRAECGLGANLSAPFSCSPIDFRFGRWNDGTCHRTCLLRGKFREEDSGRQLERGQASERGKVFPSPGGLLLVAAASPRAPPAPLPGPAVRSAPPSPVASARASAPAPSYQARARTTVSFAIAQPAPQPARGP